MARLTYDSNLNVNVDDRTLAHLQVAIGIKLHTKECFYLSWRNEIDGDGGRTSIWIHPGISLSYTYTDGRRPALDRDWIDALVRSASTPEGLKVNPAEALPAVAGNLRVRPTRDTK